MNSNGKRVDYQELEDKWNDGTNLSIKDAAQHYGINAQAMKQRIIYARGRGFNIPSRDVEPIYTAEELLGMLQSGRTSTEIAEEIDLQPSIIRSWMKQFGIKRKVIYEICD